MKLSAISDVHVKSPHDNADKLLCAFLGHDLVQSSQKILLLGDIFDLMCGPHDEYLSEFRHIFDLFENLVKSGKEVYFFEGNHDVHLDKLFSKRWPKGEVILSQDAIIQEVDGKSYYFSHGDEHEIDNISYQRYKRLILSPPMRFVANHLMPYELLNFLGNRASRMSRKKGMRVFNQDSVRDRFRQGVMATTQAKYNFILGGHSHVKDEFRLNSDSVYLNNGYALNSKTFIHIDNHQVSFPSLL